MHTALVIAERPPPAADSVVRQTQDQDWKLFLMGPEVPPAVKRAPDSTRLGEGVWLLPLASGLSTLAALVAWCERCRLTCRVLFFDEEPGWVVTKPAALPG